MLIYPRHRFALASAPISLILPVARGPRSSPARYPECANRESQIVNMVRFVRDCRLG